MKTNRSELRIGITVVLALVILISVILWGKGYSLTARTRLIEIWFEDTAGLENGAFVLVNGVRKGRVVEFVLQQDGVLVQVTVDDRVNLYSDAQFLITAPELMAAKVINIFPGISGKVPPPEFVFVGESGGGMNELMRLSTNLVQDVQNLLTVLEVTIQSINKTAGDPRLQEAFLSSIRNLDESSQRTLELITISEGKLNRVMDDLVASTHAIRDLVETNSAGINHAVSHLDSLMNDLNVISADLRGVSQALSTQEGTLGKLIHDDELANTLHATLASVDSLVQQIRDQGIQTNIQLFGKRQSPAVQKKD